MGKVRSLAACPCDRIEPSPVHGASPGFPDTVFWVFQRIAFPVEFKHLKKAKPGFLRSEFRPAQKLWWRKAAASERRALVAIGSLERGVFWVSPKEVPRLWSSDGLPEGLAVHTPLEAAAIQAMLRGAVAKER